MDITLSLLTNNGNRDAFGQALFIDKGKGDGIIG